VRTTSTASPYCLKRRTYDADIEDVWSALTDPDRMKRWFMPISGDLRVGAAIDVSLVVNRAPREPDQAGEPGFGRALRQDRSLPGLE
jgi:uncharacterized protein YndB with AHSA1/START domain